jgi:short-subunit dehydrogenase
MPDTTSLALVTGASSGIGLELARGLAARGFDLVVTAEDGCLAEVADELRAGGTETVAVRADLRTRQGVEDVHGAVLATGRPLQVAVLNAGVGQGGAFVETDVDAEQDIIDLNITSTVRLAKHVLRDMVARGEGRVLITSSIASTMPGTYQAVYNASKSFLQSFTQAVRAELADSGVTLTALMPGPTETDFFRRADMEDTKVGASDKDDPAQVAEQGIEALLADKAKVVAGSRTTKLQGLADKVLPDKAKAEAHRRMAEPGSAGDGPGPEG